MYVYVCLCEFVCTLCVQCLWRPDKGIGAVGTEVTGGFDQYHMDTGNLIEPWSVRAASTFNHWTVSSAPILLISISRFSDIKPFKK